MRVVGGHDEDLVDRQPLAGHPACRSRWRWRRAARGSPRDAIGRLGGGVRVAGMLQRESSAGRAGLAARVRAPCAGGDSQMLGCTLWLSAVTPTRFRSASRSTIAVRSADGPAASLAEEVVRSKVEVRNAASGHPLALVPDLLLRVSLRARVGVRRDRSCSTSTSHISGMAALLYRGIFSARS